MSTNGRVVPIIVARAKRDRAARAAAIQKAFEAEVLPRFVAEVSEQFGISAEAAEVWCWQQFDEQLPGVLDDGGSAVEWQLDRVYITDAPEPEDAGAFDQSVATLRRGRKP